MHPEVKKKTRMSNGNCGSTKCSFCLRQCFSEILTIQSTGVTLYGLIDMRALMSQYPHAIMRHLHYTEHLKQIKNNKLGHLLYIHLAYRCYTVQLTCYARHAL